MKVPFLVPDITEAEVDSVMEVLRSGWITTGPRVKQFEASISDYIGTEKTICLNSATTGMELSLRLLGVGPGDEVIIPAYTYTATASVVFHLGATIVMVDCAFDSFEMDYQKVSDAITERTKAIIAVDIAGRMCDYNKLLEIVTKKKNIFKAQSRMQQIYQRVMVLSDSAHGFGSSRNGVMSGMAADLTVFSFHAVKNLTTGEGGAVTWRSRPNLDNSWLYKEFSLYSLHGQSKDALAKTQIGSWEYDVIYPAYKCNMTDITAAIGINQLSRYDQMLKRREQLVQIYQSYLSKHKIDFVVHQDENHCSNMHLMLCRVHGITEEERNKIIMKMSSSGIACNVHFKPLPLLTAYKNLGFEIADYPNAFCQYQNEITLPLHSKMTDIEAHYVAKTFCNIVEASLRKRMFERQFRVGIL